MKKWSFSLLMVAGVFYIQPLVAQITQGPGGAIGPNVPTTNLNAGIGTTNPQARLEVIRDIRVSNAASPTNNYFTITTPGAYHELIATNNVGFRMNNNGQLAFILGGLTRTTMLSSGFVGIGTGTASTTSTKLHVHDGAVMVSGTNTAGGAMYLLSDNIAGGAYPNGRWGIEYLANSGLNFWQPWNPVPGGGANYRLFLKDDGKAGINIDPTFTSGSMPNSMPAGYSLFVKDGILTEKVKIALYNTVNWADYVFEDDYNLRPLEEVEAFVEANNHLPGVPSAKQLVEEGGINVNEMFAKQMEKIEELTLYIIEQNKELEVMRTRISQLENQ